MRKSICVIATLFIALSFPVLESYADCIPSEAIVGDPVFLPCDNLYKQEHKVITWPTGTDEEDVFGWGRCDYKTKCGKHPYPESDDYRQAWPQFWTPLITEAGTHWSQKVVGRWINCQDVPCSSPPQTVHRLCQEIDNGEQVFDAYGLCTTGPGSDLVSVTTCTDYYWVVQWYDCPDGWISINDCTYLFTETEYAGCY